MVTRTSEHAIRALLFLARHSGGECVPAERIARALGAPANYLSKTLNALARQGIVSSTRGPAGGFRLRRHPARVTLAEVVATFDDARPRAVCLLGDRPCDGLHPCRAHAAWSRVCAEMRAPLGATTLAGLLEPSEIEEISAAGTSGRDDRVAIAA
ncbi:Rrf2 family transcriptional regulator [Longimicrobium sp.]|uniref:RrF2 family transcriptional regulator n=1 Tax=Longimicrobium sp. TaxID=2029185 RepID=UPI002B78ADB9|nr:Rrf2 family transcriptional regulator [Longimicrobium sp.]HSU13804.1 Rrf2 family transcriptional regulator [Longimicrobium sp.]